MPKVHPGILLHKVYMKPNGISVERLAEEAEWDKDYIHNLVYGYERIDSVFAHRLALIFDTPISFWLDLQTAYDIDNLDTEWKPKQVYLKNIIL